MKQDIQSTLSREEYMQKRRDNDVRMHESKRNEIEAVRKVNLQYDDLLRDNELEFRKKRDEIMAERDQKKEEVSAKYKDERRKIWEQDTELIGRWRSQLSDLPTHLL